MRSARRMMLVAGLVAGCLPAAAAGDILEQPMEGLSPGVKLDFRIGQSLFEKFWIADREIGPHGLSDGVGPVMNAQSCAACHVGSGRSHPVARPEESAILQGIIEPLPIGVVAFSGIREPTRGTLRPHPGFGAQVQDRAVPGHMPEARIELRWSYENTSLDDGTRVTLRRPDHLMSRRLAPPHPDEVFSWRTSPPLAGLGLLEAIPEADILAGADPDDLDGDGISGRPRLLETEEGARLGRFGWKAGSESLRARIEKASFIDMGLSGPELNDTRGDCVLEEPCGVPEGRPDADPEVTAESLDILTIYVQGLAAPTPQPYAGTGDELFETARCNSCHVREWTTAEQADPAFLSGRTIYPFTDMLLHDMGPGLADDYAPGNAEGREWRTAPLWGIGRTAEVEGRESYLHDGRARSLTEAILWHGGEAEASAQAFRAMTEQDRSALLEYLRSL